MLTKFNLVGRLWVAIMLMGLLLLPTTTLAQGTPTDVTSEFSNRGISLGDAQAVADSYMGQVVSYSGVVLGITLVDDETLEIDVGFDVLCYYNGADAADLVEPLDVAYITVTGTVSGVNDDSILYHIILEDCTLDGIPSNGASAEEEYTLSRTTKKVNATSVEITMRFDGPPNPNVNHWGDIDGIPAGTSGPYALSWEIKRSDDTAEALQTIADNYAGHMVNYWGGFSGATLSDDGALVILLYDNVACIYDGPDAADLADRFKLDNPLIATGIIGPVYKELAVMSLVDCTVSMDVDSSDVRFIFGRDEFQAFVDQYAGLPISYWADDISDVLLDEATGMLTVELDEKIVCLYEGADAPALYEAMAEFMEGHGDFNLIATGTFGEIDGLSVPIVNCTFADTNQMAISINYELDGSPRTAEELEAILSPYVGEIAYAGVVQDKDDVAVQLDDYVVCLGVDTTQIQINDRLIARGATKWVTPDLGTIVIGTCSLVAPDNSGTSSDTRDFTAELGELKTLRASFDRETTFYLTAQLIDFEGTIADLQAITDPYLGDVVGYVGNVIDALSDEETFLAQLDDYIICAYEGADAADVAAQIQTGDRLNARGVLEGVNTELGVIILTDCKFSAMLTVPFIATADDLQALAEENADKTVSYYGTRNSLELVDGALHIQVDDYVVCVYEGEDAELLAGLLSTGVSDFVTGEIGTVDAVNTKLMIESCTLG